MSRLPGAEPDAIKIKVQATSDAVVVTRVSEGETWSFTAEGRWKDWWIPCGPEGYRNFLADVLEIRPRAEEHPWFRLMGMVQESPDELFPIGRGCCHRFVNSGTLVVFANDHPKKYSNNKGSITLRASRGGVPYPPDIDGPAAYSGFTGTWRLLCRTLDRTRGLSFVGLLVLGACAMLALMSQGRDLVRSVGEDQFDLTKGAGWRQIAFAAALLFLAIQVWFWPRMIITSNYGSNRKRWHPRPVLEWGPRLLGVSPFLIVAEALWANPAANTWFILALVLLAAFFLIAVIKRQDLAERLRKRSANQQPLKGFSRWWTILGFGLAVLSMALASIWPVQFGSLLGPPAVVFTGLGLIIPPLVVAIQISRGFQFPVVGALLIWAAAISL